MAYLECVEGSWRGSGRRKSRSGVQGQSSGMVLGDFVSPTAEAYLLMNA